MIGLKGIAKRAVFVIDKDGIVRHSEVLADARNEPDYDKVFRPALKHLVWRQSLLVSTVPAGGVDRSGAILEHMSSCSYVRGAPHGD